MYLEGGLHWKGLIAGRSHDVFGLAVAHARTSHALRRLGAETASATGMPNNIRRHETVIEVTYLCQIAPWWSVQPDLQGVFNPGAALPSSLQIPPRKHSLAVGARTKIDFLTTAVAGCGPVRPLVSTRELAAALLAPSSGETLAESATSVKPLQTIPCCWGVHTWLLLVWTPMPLTYRPCGIMCLLHALALHAG